MNETLDLWIFDGGLELKTIDDDGRFEGLAIPFGNEDLTKQRDVFDASTEYGRSLKGGADILYFHGLPTINGEPNPLAGRVIGEAEFKTIDAGVWMKGQMFLRDDFEKAVFGGIKESKYGLSTGSAPHRVRREKNANGSSSIKTWPIIEVSITPTPANPRTSVYPIKTLIDGLELKGLYLGDGAEANAAMSAMDSLASLARYRIGDALANPKLDAAAKADAAQGCLNEFNATAMKLIAALIATPANDAEIKSILASFGKNQSPPEAPESAGFVETLNRAASVLRWAYGNPNLNPAKVAAIKTLTASVAGYRDSVIDPERRQAILTRSQSLITRFIKD